jgi:hypothetical protein
MPRDASGHAPRCLGRAGVGGHKIFWGWQRTWGAGEAGSGAVGVGWAWCVSMCTCMRAIMCGCCLGRPRAHAFINHNLQCALWGCSRAAEGLFVVRLLVCVLTRSSCSGWRLHLGLAGGWDGVGARVVVVVVVGCTCGKGGEGAQAEVWHETGPLARRPRTYRPQPAHRWAWLAPPARSPSPRPPHAAQLAASSSARRACCTGGAPWASSAAARARGRSLPWPGRTGRGQDVFRL